MKKLFLLLLFSILISRMDAQYFWGAGCLQQHPTIMDSIIILDTFDVEPSVAGTRISYFEKRLDTIFVMECFRKPGLFTTAVTLVRKVNIGKLSSGAYTVIVHGIFRDTTCEIIRDTFRNKLSFKLEVLTNPNNINEQKLDITSLKSTIIHDRLEIIDLPPKSFISIFDLQGQTCFSKEISDANTFINTESLYSGIYVLSIQLGGEYKRWRILKE